jgi:hypothetical protein
MTAFICLSGWREVLFFYYIWDRPVGTQPGLGWTEPLGWGRYGSIREAANLFWLMLSGALAFGIMATGGAIRICKLGENVFSNRTELGP